MAPQVGFDSEQLRDKARKDLLDLLEGVRAACYLWTSSPLCDKLIDGHV